MELLADFHQKVIHFPISFLILYPVIEMLFFITKKDFLNKTALIFLFIGVIGAIAAVLTGNQAFIAHTGWSDESLALFSKHESLANIVTWLYTAILVFRYFLVVKRKLSKGIHIIILLIAFGGIYFVYQTGEYGGRLAESKISSSSLSQ